MTDNLNKVFQNETSSTLYDWLSPLAEGYERKQQEIYNTGERQDGMALL